MDNLFLDYCKEKLNNYKMSFENNYILFYGNSNIFRKKKIAEIHEAIVILYDNDWMVYFSDFIHTYGEINPSVFVCMFYWMNY